MDLKTFPINHFYPFHFYFPEAYNAIATNSQGITLISPHPSVQAARIQEQQMQQQHQVQVQQQIQQQKQHQHQVSLFLSIFWAITSF